MTLLSFCRVYIVRYFSLLRLNFLGCPGKTEKISSLILLRNKSKAGEPFGGFHVDLSLYVEICIAESSKSLCKSASLINDGVGEKPKPFSRTLISVLHNTFLLRLNTESEEKEPLMQSLSVSKTLSLIIPND